MQVDYCCNRKNLLNNKNCGQSFANRILGGERAGLAQFPWIARIRYISNFKDSMIFNCGGSLISEQYVLTAAHCTLTKSLEVGDYNLYEFFFSKSRSPTDEKIYFLRHSVRLGEHTISTAIDCDQPGVDYTCYRDEPVLQDIVVKNIVRHHNYDEGWKQNDIALLRLEKKAKMTPNVQTICIPIEPDQAVENTDEEDKNMIVAGWGSTGRRHKFSDFLRYGVVPYVDLSKCVEIYEDLSVKSHKKNYNITEYHLVSTYLGSQSTYEISYTFIIKVLN